MSSLIVKEKKKAEAHDVLPGCRPTTLTYLIFNLIPSKDFRSLYKYQTTNTKVRVSSKNKEKKTNHKKITRSIINTCNLDERPCIELVNSSCCSIKSAIVSSSLAENVAFSVDMELVLCLTSRDKWTEWKNKRK